jgi:hypothetical protein
MRPYVISVLFLIFLSSCKLFNKSNEAVFLSKTDNSITSSFDEQVDSQPQVTYFIKLNEIDKNDNFHLTSSDEYILKNSNFKISISKIKIKNKVEGKKHILNKRMILNQSYSVLIAPYFGLVEADQDCMRLVDVKGESSKKDKSIEVTKMKFAVNENEQLIDCNVDKPVGTATYFLVSCQDYKSVYEIKIFSKIGEREPDLELRCF